MKFLDEVKVYVKSGDGGGGCVSFRREKFVEYGGPDGGNGGKGGDIIIRCVDALNTLIDFRYQQHFKAQTGESGMGRNKSGKSRDPIILQVPVGTEVLDEHADEVLFDFTEVGQELKICKGGDGGLGNANFKSSVNQAPTKSTPGWPGEEKWVWLRLKLISDVGLVGLPNAGKSTLLSRVTAAKPKIADYPFTTLKPQLGVVYIDQSEFVMADIPGLIEGAHLGVGLGDKFLKHIERCKVLIHLIDITQEDVIKPYQTIRDELENYSEVLTEKQEIIVLNKIDTLTQEEIKEKQQILSDYVDNKVLLVSGVSGEGLEQLLRATKKIIDESHNIQS
ncbi:GTPase ObgE [Rickettsiales endosymbiont of Stachyamoeba lipophora]|uniref:GTPase ObgE n=1 Tax=Rickettsiales endosymbiont of Stachyamoeba lipophora TaxID=2486578 RepID=UPI000F6452B2|nr:GTPase ObgE [Rickettsiales endosymbiont of Stachyamoeba lipophora]AZL15186.1 GTPase ObgE [Rickettsiales endosymbiont of Stachyamoeba lipophora]